MNWNWKQKWPISLVVIFTMLFSAVLTAAATEPDVQSVVMADAESAAEQAAGSATERETESAAEKDAESETEQAVEQATETATESVTEQATESETETATESATEPTAESETEQATESEIETETEPADEKDTDSAAEDGAGDETEIESESDSLTDNSDDEVTADPEFPGSISLEDFTAAAHEHSWSADWSCDESFHWHECGAEDCPVTVCGEKEGYGEHIYGDDGVCTVCGCLGPDSRPARTAAGAVPTYQEAYEAMIALKDKYPEGMAWTNFTPYGSQGELGDSYVWKGGRIYGSNRGVGCAAFSFLLSDAAFDSLPARVIERGGFTLEDVKIGDILRVNGNSHSVIVLQKSEGGVVVAEGNYNKSVHWGRVLTRAEVLNADYVITRYPKGYVPSDESDADTVMEEGTEGNLHWSLTKGGKLTISGSGMMPNYSAAQLPSWNGYGVSAVVIENGVTSIGDYAFYQSTALSIYLPEGITRIGQNAFDGSALISVTIPGTVGVIGDNAFHGCGNLASVTVSEGVKTIGNEAFRGCTSLTHIDFPASITSVGSGAFMSCEKMTRVRFMPGSGKVTLGGGLFAQCYGLISVTLPQTAECISDNMFQSCTVLPVLYIPANVTSIGENPFTECKSLKYIYFGGTEDEWNSMASVPLKLALQSKGTTVIFNAAFDDPFAPDPDDPGDFWPDEDGKDPVEPDDGDSAHKHNWSAAWSSDETGHWHECGAGCSITDNRNKDGYGAHSYGSWVVDVKAAASQDGSRHRDCTVCSYRQTERIPAAGSGDNAGESNDNTGSSGGSTGGSNDNTGNSGGSTGGSNDNAGSSGGSTGGSNGDTGSSGGSTGGSNDNAGGSGDHADDSNENDGSSNDHSDSPDESGNTGGNGASGNQGNGYAELQKQQESLAAGNQRAGSGMYPVSRSGSANTGNLPVAAKPEKDDTASDALSEGDGEERRSDDEDESDADEESLPPQEEETEPASDALSEGDEIQQVPDREIKAEDASQSDKKNTGVIVSVVSVLGGGTLGSAYVFMRRKYHWKK